MAHLIDAEAFVRFETARWRSPRVIDTYHRFFGPITARAVEPLLDAAAVGPTRRVLDVATGPGYLAGRAAARGAEVTGVDIAPEMLVLARRLWPDVTFRTADAHNLPLEDASCDAVVANFLVPHLADHEQAVQEFVRVLRPGGLLALSTWDHPERVPLLGAFIDAIRLSGAGTPADVPPGPDFFRYADGQKLAGLLWQAGLRDVAVDRLEFTHTLGSTDELWEGVIGGSVRTAALVRGQPPHVQERIRRTFGHLVAHYRVEAGLQLPVSVRIGAAARPS